MTDPVVVTYPYDSSGILASNRIYDEQHVITENNFRDFYFVVPKHAPFFVGNLVIKHSYQGVVTTLVENVDYYCAMMFIGATRAAGKAVYGGITFNNLNTAGIVSLEYNTLGGDWNVDEQYVIEQVAEKAYNPRTVSWEQIVNTPTIFPPTPHDWNLVDMVGEAEVVAALGGIENAIANAAPAGLTAHTGNFNNPHFVTKTQIGLDKVQNCALATQSDVLAGTSSDTLVTPNLLNYFISNVALQNYYTIPQIDSKFANVYTQSQVDTKIATVNTAVNTTNTNVTNLSNNLSQNYYTQAQVNTAIANAIKPLNSRAKNLFLSAAF